MFSQAISFVDVIMKLNTTDLCFLSSQTKIMNQNFCSSNFYTHNMSYDHCKSRKINLTHHDMHIYHRSSEGIHSLHEKLLAFSCSFSSTHIILKTDVGYVIKSVFTLISYTGCIATPSHLVKMFILGVACNLKQNLRQFHVLVIRFKCVPWSKMTNKTMQTELIYNDFIFTLAFNSLKVFSQVWLIIYFF